MIHTKNTPVSVTYLTEKGLEKLQAELDYLQNVKRDEIAKSLHNATDNEEPCENGEYMLVKNEQSWVEGRICELKKLLNRVEIIKPLSIMGQITLGSIVTIQESCLPTESYTIVGTAEANTKEGFISDESPMGRALLDHKVGDVVEVAAPDGNFRVRIISVS
jgi:transcription elongation factor GreA